MCGCLFLPYLLNKTKYEYYRTINDLKEYFAAWRRMQSREFYTYFYPAREIFVVLIKFESFLDEGILHLTTVLNKQTQS